MCWEWHIIKTKWIPTSQAAYIIRLPPVFDQLVFIFLSVSVYGTCFWLVCLLVCISCYHTPLFLSSTVARVLLTIRFCVWMSLSAAIVAVNAVQREVHNGLTWPKPSLFFSCRMRSTTMNTALLASVALTCSPVAHVPEHITSTAWTRPSKLPPRGYGSVQSANRR